MKKIFVSVLILMATITISCSQTPATGEPESVFGPKIEFADTEHDFGTIEQGGNGIFDFVFSNTGTEPLVLSNVRSSCGCTIPQWPREPIDAGNDGKIEVKYDTQRLGNFSKTITVYSNAQEEPITLRIKGVVNPKTATE